MRKLLECRLLMSPLEPSGPPQAESSSQTIILGARWTPPELLSSSDPVCGAHGLQRISAFCRCCVLLVSSAYIGAVLSPVKQLGSAVIRALLQSVVVRKELR